MNASDLIQGKSYKIKQTMRISKSKYQHLNMTRLQTGIFLHESCDRFIFELSNGKRVSIGLYCLEKNVFEMKYPFHRKFWACKARIYVVCGNENLQIKSKIHISEENLWHLKMFWTLSAEELRFVLL